MQPAAREIVVPRQITNPVASALQNSCHRRYIYILTHTLDHLMLQRSIGLPRLPDIVPVLLVHIPGFETFGYHAIKEVPILVWWV